MKNIQELKTWAEDEQENAHNKELHYETIGDYHRYLTMSSRRSAFSEMLRELNLLLSERPLRKHVGRWAK